MFFSCLWALTVLNNLVYSVHACMNVRKSTVMSSSIISIFPDCFDVLGKFHIDFCVALNNAWPYIRVCGRKGEHIVHV